MLIRLFWGCGAVTGAGPRWVGPTGDGPRWVGPTGDGPRWLGLMGNGPTGAIMGMDAVIC